MEPADGYQGHCHPLTDPLQRLLRANTHPEGATGLNRAVIEAALGIGRDGKDLMLTTNWTNDSLKQRRTTANAS